MSRVNTFAAVILLLLPLTTAQDYFDGACASDADCIADQANSVCDTANTVKIPDPTNSSLTVDANLCVCATDYFAFDTSGDFATGKCVHEGEFFSTACSTNADCQADHTDAECEVRNILANTDPDEGPVSMLFCRCQAGWQATDMTDPLKPTGGCRLQADLEARCELSNTDCLAENSVCKDDGSNQGVWRCQCMDGYITFQDANTLEYLCGAILTSQKYPDLCSDCEDNHGTCHTNTTMAAFLADPDSQEANYECDCPITQIDNETSGEDCGVYLANVTCVIGDFLMRVCYTPHPHVNFSTGAALFADGYGDDEACKGEDISADPEDAGCPAGAERRLVLELSSDKKDQCGVTEYRHTRSIVFEKTIVVTDDDVIDGLPDIYFDVFCKFDTYKDSGFGGVGVIGVPGNDQGEHLEPLLQFNVYDALNKEIAENVAIRLGDMIRFGLTLTDDGTYAAAHVLACTASTSPKLPDDDATTQALLFDSCPADEQRVFTKDNLWRMVSGQSNQLQTGLIESFKLSTGFEVFMHCRIKLCLKGSEDDCGPVSCEGANSVGRRRRRQADNDDVEVTRRISYYDSEDEEDSGKVEMDKAGFALLISALLIILIVLAILVVLLFIKLRSRGGQVEDFGAPPNKQPQRFALPRIGNSHMRM